MFLAVHDASLQAKQIYPADEQEQEGQAQKHNKDYPIVIDIGQTIDAFFHEVGEEVAKADHGS